MKIIIIGAGPGGYECAAEMAAAGHQVTLIEKGELGGTCLNRGCIPTKCLCASAETILAVRGAAEFGVDVGSFTASYARAAERMRQVVGQLRAGVESLLAQVEVVNGEASLCLSAGKPAVRVGGQVLQADKIIIATGSAPAALPIPGAELAMTSDDFLKLDELPARVAIIGGGVIGMEFASILAAFGVETTVIEYCPEILPPFDKEVAKRLRTALGRRGVKAIVGAGVSSLAKDGDGICVAYAGKKGEERLACDAVIMAVGRKPVAPAGCAEAGVALTARGCIEVDENMSTTAPGVYAIGDANGKCMLAHAASAQGRVVQGQSVDLGLIPSAVFTLPECAMVGLTEEQLKASGQEYAKGKAMFAGNGKALAMGQGDGFVKVLRDPQSGKLLGVHVIGPHAADIVAEAAACMAAGLTASQVSTSIVHGHPTLGEAFASACK